MSENPDPCCADCAFAHSPVVDQRECRADPPQVVAIQVPGATHILEYGAMFPNVPDFWWCGRFQRRPPPPPKPDPTFVWDSNPIRMEAMMSPVVGRAVMMLSGCRMPSEPIETMPESEAIKALAYLREAKRRLEHPLSGDGPIPKWTEPRTTTTIEKAIALLSKRLGV